MPSKKRVKLDESSGTGTVPRKRTTMVNGDGPLVPTRSRRSSRDQSDRSSNSFSHHQSISSPSSPPPVTVASKRTTRRSSSSNSSPPRSSSSARNRTSLPPSIDFIPSSAITETTKPSSRSASTTFKIPKLKARRTSQEVGEQASSKSTSKLSKPPASRSKRSESTSSSQTSNSFKKSKNDSQKLEQTLLESFADGEAAPVKRKPGRPFKSEINRLKKLEKLKLQNEKQACSTAAPPEAAPASPPKRSKSKSPSKSSSRSGAKFAAKHEKTCSSTCQRIKMDNLDTLQHHLEQWAISVEERKYRLQQEAKAMAKFLEDKEEEAKSRQRTSKKDTLTYVSCSI